MPQVHAGMCQPCLCVGTLVHASCGLFWLFVFVGVNHALAVRAEVVVLAPEKDEN